MKSVFPLDSYIYGEKADYMAPRAWMLKEVINKGKLKGLEQHDYVCLKLVNKAYNMRNWDGYVLGDDKAEQLSDEGFNKLKEIFEEYGK